MVVAATAAGGVGVGAALTLSPLCPPLAPPLRFLAATINNQKLQREELLAAAFKRFDENGDGQISRQELSSALSDPSLGVDPKEIDEIIDLVDADGSGTIDYTEFCAMMRNTRM